MAIFASFARYLLNLQIWDRNYYIMLCSPLVALRRHQNIWPWMISNGHFALKFVSGSATNELAFLAADKTVRKFAELPIYCQRQKCSPGILVSSEVGFMWIFTGVRWRGGVKWEWGRQKWRFSLLSLCISSKPSHRKRQLLYYAV